MEKINDLLLEAANLLGVGMVVVFLFLGLLIFCIKGMSKLFAGEIEAPKTPRPTRATGGNTQVRSAQITAAISAAIHQHRQNNK
ncbi:OadG family protein [Catenovulum sp. SM1970]|uniref:OadG family protein n=1 Tax=Marinifaba aquimaris TaxID=2741323 RepID=UPI0015720840|nr:OadG family transporter subunit [Marinifaba aquimaris]NTS77589.1 OadG family protein [Marinifaba aquimaris]